MPFQGGGGWGWTGFLGRRFPRLWPRKLALGWTLVASSRRGNRGVGIEAWESRRGNRGGVWSTRLARRVARDQFSAQRHLGLLFAARHRVVMFA